MTGCWRCRERALPVADRVHVMGILNVTPDSFSDGGAFLDREAAVGRGLRMVSEGADIIDVGGESTRPGAEPVTAEVEIARVVPVVEALAGQTDVPVSVDTTRAVVAKAALEAGASIVNDVSALRFDAAMTGVAAAAGAGLVLMHMLGTPATMQQHPRYQDVVTEVRAALVAWAEAAVASGVERERIVIDPGIGFGKTPEHNLTLLKHLPSLASAGFPVMVGPSRKSFIGLILGTPVGERVEGTAAAIAWAVANGARIVRVHDVKQIVRVVRMTEAIMGAD